MALLVEIHVPVTPTPDLPPGTYPLPWIEQVEDFLVELEEDGAAGAFALVTDTEAPDMGTGRRVDLPAWPHTWQRQTP
jgi:hypothetical protein